MRTLPLAPLSSAPETPSAVNLPEIALRLDRWFQDCPHLAVAFSGGVDSALVAYWARRQLGRDRITAWTADSPSLKRQDLELARGFCTRHDIVMREFATNEIDDPNYASNPVNRCYYCKSTLYQTLAEALAGSTEEVWICSGVNLDDQSDYRPSMKAAAEARIRHPLLECGVGKAAIRALAQTHGLEIWDKPASPCMSSRIPYGQAVTRTKLSQIEAAETWLQDRGFPVCRVRHFGDGAVVEVPEAKQSELTKLLADLRPAFISLGFSTVEVDAEGFVSGKLNRVIGQTIAGVRK